VSLAGRRWGGMGVNVGRSTQKARENARSLNEFIAEERAVSRNNQNRKIDSFAESHYQGLEALKPPPHFSRGAKILKFIQVPVPTGIAVSNNHANRCGGAVPASRDAWAPSARRVV